MESLLMGPNGESFSEDSDSTRPLQNMALLKIESRKVLVHERKLRLDNGFVKNGRRVT